MYLLPVPIFVPSCSNLDSVLYPNHLTFLSHYCTFHLPVPNTVPSCLQPSHLPVYILFPPCPHLCTSISPTGISFCCHSSTILSSFVYFLVPNFLYSVPFHVLSHLHPFYLSILIRVLSCPKPFFNLPPFVYFPVSAPFTSRSSFLYISVPILIRSCPQSSHLAGCHFCTFLPPTLSPYLQQFLYLRVPFLYLSSSCPQPSHLPVPNLFPSSPHICIFLSATSFLSSFLFFLDPKPFLTFPHSGTFLSPPLLSHSWTILSPFSYAYVLNPLISWRAPFLRSPVHHRVKFLSHLLRPKSPHLIVTILAPYQLSIFSPVHSTVYTAIFLLIIPLYIPY